MSQQRPLLDVLRRHPTFRKLWTAQLISQTGDWLSRTAVLGLLSSLGARDAIVGVGALYAAELATRLLPSALLYPLAGPAADRLPRRFLMVGADVLRIFIVLGLLLVDEPSDLPLLYGLVIAQVGLGTFFASAQAASIPSIVGKEDLQDAYAISSATWSFTLSLGAALGGLSVKLLGTHGAIAVDAATYVVSASLLLRLRLPPVEKHPQEFRLRDILLFTDIRRGLSHVRERGAGSVLLAKSLWGGAGGFLVALPLLSRQRFASIAPDGVPDPESVGLIVGLFFAARGLGTGLGPILARRFMRDRDSDLRFQIRLGYALGATGYALIPFVDSLPAAFACVALSHSGGSMLWVASTTFWQRKVDNAFRGRVFSLEFLGMTLTFALGGLVAALVFDATQDLSRMLWTSSGLVILGGLLWSLIAAGKRSDSTDPPTAPVTGSSTAPPTVPEA